MTFLRNICGKVRDYAARASHQNHSYDLPEVYMYHHISKKSRTNWGPWQISLSKDKFQRQVEKIDEHRTVISVDQLNSYIRDGKRLPPNPAVITFDDGYTKFDNRVIPTLEKYKIPATVYMSTKLMENGDPPYEFRLASALVSSSEVQIKISNKNINYRLSSKTDIIEAYNTIRDLSKDSKAKVQRRIVTEIGESSDLTGKIMSTEEIKMLAEHPLITVGSHGHEHIPFSTLTAKEQKTNIETCRDRLTELLGEPPKHFSFPYGSFNDSAIQAVREAGFETAVTTQSRPVSPRDWGRPYTIPRIDAATGLTTSDVEIFSMNQ